MIFSLFRKDERRVTIGTLYTRVAEASRGAGLYLALGVPDTLEGRFESLSLHMILVLRALRRLPPPADDVAADLTDALFSDLDAALREMGVGDTTVPKRMKTMASAFYGRAQAYDAPLDSGDEAALALALAKNVTADDQPATALARYALAADSLLKTADLDTILKQGPAFPQAETFKEGA
ncbi:ubiquinol-cytochrome C chaperone family protein [Microvirga flavescens]|uniref:ubiquinol-cytochrome C chaperone family protein n=1 Tax=Microvirga flavescens TaxID=2249811 RepID=UPI000DD5BDE8|nr:ubiquinol-cytochrome C chaperone family protein [Microvirga flavescens]